MDGSQHNTTLHVTTVCIGIHCYKKLNCKFVCTTCIINYQGEYEKHMLITINNYYVPLDPIIHGTLINLSYDWSDLKK